VGSGQTLHSLHVFLLDWHFAWTQLLDGGGAGAETRIAVSRGSECA